MKYLICFYKCIQVTLLLGWMAGFLLINKNLMINTALTLLALAVIEAVIEIIKPKDITSDKDLK